MHDCKTKYNGQIMTASKAPIKAFISDNPGPTVALVLEAIAPFVTGCIILISFMTLSNAQHNEDIFFIWKYLLLSANLLYLILQWFFIGL